LEIKKGIYGVLRAIEYWVEEYEGLIPPTDVRGDRLGSLFSKGKQGMHGYK
jgi:hypothetical protein